jgi:hypothetical protein
MSRKLFRREWFVVAVGDRDLDHGLGVSSASKKTNHGPKASAVRPGSSKRGSPSARGRNQSAGTSIVSASDSGPERPSRRSGSERVPPSKSEGVLIELTEVQVNQVLRGTSQAGSLAALFSGHSELTDALVKNQPALRSYDGFDNAKVSRSLLQALLILSTLPADGGYMGVQDICALVAISPSTVHRYLTTWVLAGWVDRDPRTRRYRRPMPGA